MKKIIISFTLLISITIHSQSWQSYNNRIPAWPQDINESSVGSFQNSLKILKDEIHAKIPNTMSRYENLTQAEAMKLAQQYQKNAMNLSPQEMARRAQLNEQAVDVELPDEMELGRRLSEITEEFDNTIYDEVAKLREEFPCEPGAGDTGCDILSAELKKMADKLGAEYFIGRKAKLRSIIDEINDYMIKKKLPVTVQRERDQYELLGDKSAAESSGLSIVESCVDNLIQGAERLEWLAKLKSDTNYFYTPGGSN